MATVDQAQCPACTVAAPEQAIDGDLETAASLYAPAVVAGFAGLRVTAQQGVVYPAGSRARAIVAFAGLARNEVASASALRTYLAGVLQEQVTFESNLLSPSVIYSNERRQYSFQASKPYDAVAFGIAGEAQNIQIDYYEYCAD